MAAAHVQIIGVVVPCYMRVKDKVLEKTEKY